MKTDTDISQQLDKILRRHTLSSIGVGLLPTPGLDLAGLMVIQTNMIKEIAAIYEVPFTQEAVKNILAALVGRALLVNTAPLLASVIKAVPLLGQAIGMTMMPMSCGASTYAAGKVFIRHFTSGGTLLTFDIKKMKSYYTDMLKEGKGFAEGMRKTA